MNTKINPTVSNWYDASHNNHIEFVSRVQKKIASWTMLKYATSLRSPSPEKLANSRNNGAVMMLILRSFETKPPTFMFYLRQMAYHMGFDLDEAAAEQVAVVTGRLAQ